MIINKIWLWRWDRFTRYNPVIEYLHNKYGTGNVSILEVGSGDYSASLYNGYVVDGMDLIKPKNPLAVRKFYNESIVDTNIKDNQYDIVICVDTLEHIPKNQRQIALDKMVQISKKEVLLVYPSGDKATKLDSELYTYYQKHIGKHHRWFQEHLEFGLPSDLELDHYVSLITKKGKAVRANKRNITDIHKLRLYSKFMMSKSYFRFLFKNKLLYIFNRFFGALIGSGNYYRRFVIINVE